MNKKNLFRVVPLTLLAGLGILAVILSVMFLLVHSGAIHGSTDKQLIDSLVSIREYSRGRVEFPVSAILVYGDSIIGRGCNTFIEKNDPTGHAEINAIKNAFESFGYKGFSQLDHSKLVMLTSYEPCMMCTGLCGQYGIKRICYLQKRPSGLRWRQLRIKFLNNYRVRRLRVTGT